MDRRSTFLWMKDLLDHLRNCTDLWQTAGRTNGSVWAEAMCRDLDELRHLCDRLRAEAVSAR